MVLNLIGIRGWRLEVEQVVKAGPSRPRFELEKSQLKSEFQKENNFI